MKTEVVRSTRLCISSYKHCSNFLVESVSNKTSNVYYGLECLAYLLPVSSPVKLKLKKKLRVKIVVH